MGYLHIDNLYMNQTILLLRECYALEKIHGTSAHVAWDSGKVRFFSGGAKHESFLPLFDEAELVKRFIELGHDKVIVFGEAYGGKVQAMKETYGNKLIFVAFDVRINNTWLDVPNANDVVTKLGLEFVHWDRIPANIESIDAARDLPSIQAMRNLGDTGFGKKSEGVVLRPIWELFDNRGNRIIAKHKRDDFRETRTPREVNPDKLKVLEDANAIALEWATDSRLRHVLDKFPADVSMNHMSDIIKAMIGDIIREGRQEIIDSKEARKAIGKATVALFKTYLREKPENQ